MRKKIDYLIPLNWVWLLVIVAYVCTSSRNLLLVAASGAVLSVLYSLFLQQRLGKHVEKCSRGRLRVRIFYNCLISLTIVALSVLLYSLMR